MDYLHALVLGLVEGVTEFLPVSSTGHLILTGHLLGFTGDKANAFEVIIQLGAILAVVVMFRSRFWGLVRPRPGVRFSGFRGLSLLFLTTLPAGVAGFIAADAIDAYLFGPVTVAWALGVGAAAILVVEYLKPRGKYATLDEMTPLLALGIGCFQCLALWPGFSRSAATIMGGMLLGADRRLAAEYSFIAAAPVMTAATIFKLAEAWTLFTPEDMGVLALGFAVSFVSAWFAVRGFIALLSRITLRPFAYYRLVLAPLVLLFRPGN